MPQVVKIVLTYAGAGTGPFDLYSDSNTFASPFETNISKADLLAGYTSVIVPDDATQIRIMSVGGGVCVGNFIDLNIPVSPTPTPTPSPLPFFLGNLTLNSNSGGACAGIGTVINNVYGDSSTFCTSTTFTNAVFASYPFGTYIFAAYGGSFMLLLTNGTSVASSAGPCSVCPSPSATPSVTPSLTPTPTPTPSIPTVYSYTVVLDFIISGVCGGGSTTVYSYSNNFNPGIQIFYDSLLSVPVTGYDYVYYILDGIVYNLNTSNGVVGSNTGYSC